MATRQTPKPHDARVLAMRDIRALVAALYQSARTLERTTGMTNAQLFLLRQLMEHDQLSVNELAKRAMTKQSAMSLLVTRLEKSGHVRRERSSEDARRIDVSITTAGRRIARRSPEAPIDRLLTALHKLDEREVRALARALGSLLTAMGVNAAEAPMLFERARSGTRG